ncbi:primosomal protein N' [Thioalkalivibrio sp. XN279]|uniref:primosomal protein N' n=1 Tax=Thioalkalivibrio sp. XN279 TaxID=2714953 RepID=UPI00140C3E79|nr:primosomal protein N' [Thioalkalivibrio sp. XN279]NHA15713.1 primosomal protein N' [Thioalkalivibrio sp. XN279]
MTILRVAVDAPLDTLFDYLAPAAGPAPAPGTRVRVPFGRRRPVGLVMAHAPSSDLPPERLKPVQETLDEAPLFDPGLLQLLAWTARYYHEPPGSVAATALPAPLRQGRPLPEPPLRVSARGPAPDAMTRRAPKQAALLDLLSAGPRRADDPTLPAGWRATAARLAARGLVDIEPEPAAASWDMANPGPELNAAQADAVADVLASLGSFSARLLFGVTGSGKTEVYLAAAAECLRRGLQVLVLVPEIGLTPQLVQRFSARLGVPVATLHSGLGASARLAAWADARAGRAAVVIGTRSAAFVPLARPGLIIVDEEHDPSLRQHEGLRYSGRDVAVMRASISRIPVVLGSATPALESLRHAREGRYALARLPERPGAARHPAVRLVDLRRHPASEGLSGPLLRAMAQHLEKDGQVLLFLNRRGFAPALFCASCGWTADCRHCDARYTWHRRAARLRCHHCGHETALPPACPDCGADLRPAGEGTERLEEALVRRFPGVALARIDRDSTRRQGAVDRILDDVRDGRTRILVGTQMMAKGHDFPGVTLVGIINADQGLFGTDFRASERLAQTLVQVAGRAGRADRPGEVLVQTAYPEHPLLRRLLEGGYEAFAEATLEERRAAGWPPYSHLALLRAEADRPQRAMAFLAALRDAVRVPRTVTVLGPAPAPMEKRGGRWRAQLLLQSAARPALHRALDACSDAAPGLAESRGVRWFIEVDPQDLF